MEIPEPLHCLFTAQVVDRDGTYVIEIPESELQHGPLVAGGGYRVAVMAALERGGHGTSTSDTTPETTLAPPPVERGDSCVLEIEAIGEQGDGIGRIDAGYVVIVPDTDPGDRVRVEIGDVHETVAFATVTNRFTRHE